MNWYKKASPISARPPHIETYLDIGHPVRRDKKPGITCFMWYLDRQGKFHHKQTATRVAHEHWPECQSSYKNKQTLSEGRVECNENEDCTASMTIAAYLSTLQRHRAIDVTEQVLDRQFNHPSIHIFR